MKSAGGCITSKDARLLFFFIGRGHGGILYAIAAIAIIERRGGTKMKYWAIVLMLATTAAISRAAPPKFELVEGDRVVYIGNTFVERDLQHNYLETMLTGGFRDRNFTFRNMGWSGDTVFVPA